MNCPEYSNNSIVNLISSVLEALGEKSHYAPLEGFNYPLTQYQNVVFMVIDGLSYNFLMNQNEGILRNNVKKKLSSVFPTTTAAAVTSFLSGEAPLQHAMTGWYMYFKELGCTSLSLPFCPRFAHQPYDTQGIHPSDIFVYKNIFDRLFIPYTIISPNKTINSAYSNHSFGSRNKIGYENHQDFFKIVGKKITENIENPNASNNMIYAYYPYFDEFAHIYGIGSQNCVDLYNKFEYDFRKLKEQFTDSNTLFIITADHGLVDVPNENKLRVSDYPKLAETLTLPLCGEGRVPFCYVRSSKTKQFTDFISNEFSEYCEMISIDEALEQNLFGLGEMHPRFYERVGDFILLMKDHYILIDPQLNEKEHPFVGFHGGLSDDELYVPLIVIE